MDMFPFTNEWYESVVSFPRAIWVSETYRELFDAWSMINNKRICRNIEISLGPLLTYAYEGAKEMLLVDNVDNKDFLRELLEAMYEELPAAKKRKK